jgi:hypothetical protein
MGIKIKKKPARTGLALFACFSDAIRVVLVMWDMESVPVFCWWLQWGLFPRRILFKK